jgi:hypothetical protein
LLRGWSVPEVLVLGWVIFRAPRPAAPDRKGQFCKVLVQARGPGPRNVLLEFEDGYRLVSIRADKSIRKPWKRERQGSLI